MEDRRLWRIGLTGIMGITWMAVFVAPLQAQVGLGSGVARITLMAHVPPRGSIQGMGAQREIGLVGGIREVSVSVRMSANTGYWLQVHRTGAPGTRIWVRTSAGDFRELTTDVPMTVAGDHRPYHGEREVQFRIEGASGGEQSGPLPVRYEIAIRPTL